MEQAESRGHKKRQENLDLGIWEPQDEQKVPRRTAQKLETKEKISIEKLDCKQLKLCFQPDLLKENSE